MEERNTPAGDPEHGLDDPDLVDETEFDDEELSLGFPQNRLPWIVGAAVLLVFLVTLNRWIRLESLATIARATGWDLSAQVYGPLLTVVTAPFRMLPGAWQPTALNVLAAVMGAASVALLVRCIALLPYDRTQESRQRERSDYSLLSIPLAWVPALFGGLVLAFTLTFWEHATAFTGEMLDLLLFASITHLLLSYRVSRREAALWFSAFLYGLGMANNYAMIAFFPCYIAAVVGLRGFAFFNFNFLVKMFGCGVAGLLLYLLLPLIELSADRTGAGFWAFFKMSLGAQKAALLGFPPYILLILSFTSLLPVFLLAIRWPENVGDTSAAGAVASLFITRVLHIAMLVAALSALVDARWGPRALSQGGAALLPLYFLSALAVGYYSGYLLLVFRTSDHRRHRREPSNMRLLNGLITGLTLLAGVALPAYLLVKNFLPVQQRNGEALRAVADMMVESLPADSAYLLSDGSIEPLLVAGALHRKQGSNPHVMVSTPFLRLPVYHQQLAKRYPGRWSSFETNLVVGRTIPEGFVSELIAEKANTESVYYLHPTFGYFLELTRLRPEGMVYRVLDVGTNVVSGIKLDQALVERNERFWDAHADVLPEGGSRANEASDTRYARRILSRALNLWGVSLQRSGRVALAEPRLEQALAANPENVSARLNLDFNARLASGELPPLDLAKALDVEDKRATWDGLIGRHGPFDNPPWCFRLGVVYAQSSLFRQALHEFSRLHSLYPDHPDVKLWTRNMEALTLLGLGKRDQALESALSLVEEFPNRDASLETLTQVYIYREDPTNALANVKRQLALNAENERALLNQGALSIQLRRFSEAISPLSQLLVKRPDHDAARLNRAIAFLQNGDLDRAREDYEMLLKDAPNYFPLHFGLGEIARLQNRTTDALAHYARYLEHAREGTAEYERVRKHVAEMTGSSAAP